MCSNFLKVLRLWVSTSIRQMIVLKLHKVKAMQRMDFTGSKLVIYTTLQKYVKFNRK